MTTIMKPVKDLKPYDKNAKLHDKKQIDNVAKSISKYGFVQPVVVDKDGVIVIGHCRVMAAKQLGLETVPCVCVDELTPEQVNELRIVDNKSNESGWDLELLADDLANIDLSDFDFDFEIKDPDADVTEDDVPEVNMQEPPKAVQGDIYKLGRHRLMCGDSTIITDVEKLMVGGACRFAFNRSSL